MRTGTDCFRFMHGLGYKNIRTVTVLVQIDFFLIFKVANKTNSREAQERFKRGNEPLINKEKRGFE